VTEWNLSVRLTGQGSGLARTLRDTAADARNASNEVNALRRNLALLRTEAANDIRIRLDVDGAHLRSDVTAPPPGPAKACASVSMSTPRTSATTSQPPSPRPAPGRASP